MKSFVIFFSIFFAVSSIQSATVQVAVGWDHTIFLDSFGQMYATGNNDHGQLGIPGYPSLTTPTRIPFPQTIVTVACGPQTSYAIDNQGSLWAWGKNDLAELGLGHSLKVAAPEKMDGLPSMTRIAPGIIHTLAVDSNGGIWRWNELENNGPIEWDETLALANVHTVLMNKEGQTFIWKASPQVNAPSQAVMRKKPRLLQEISRTFSIFHGQINSLTSIGSNQMMLVDRYQPWIMSSQEIAPLANICESSNTFVASNFSRLFCKDKAGQLFARGMNTNGELGLGHTMHQMQFSPVHFN